MSRNFHMVEGWKTCRHTEWQKGDYACKQCCDMCGTCEECTKVTMDLEDEEENAN